MTSNPSPYRLIVGGRVFDGSTLLQNLRVPSVLISNGRISELGVSESDAPPGTIVDSYPGSTVLPGLIDCHVHLSGRRGYGLADRIQNSDRLRTLRAANDCFSLLSAGFTTVRDVGGTTAIDLRAAEQERTIIAPRISPAGPIISQTGGHADHRYLPVCDAETMDGTLLADGVDACLRAVRLVDRLGADWTKFCTTGGVGSAGDHPHNSHFTQAEADTIVEEAHRLGMRAACHAQGLAGIETALRAGVDSIEHGTYLNDNICRQLVASGCILVPTVALRRAFIAARNFPGDMPAWRITKQEEAIDNIRIGFQLALEHGVQIAAGSDYTGVPLREHGDNAVELLTMVELGMSPLDALRSATSVAASLLDNPRIGSLRPGMHADVLVVEGDVTRNIECVRTVISVYKNGAPHPHRTADSVRHAVSEPSQTAGQASAQSS